MIYHNPIFDKTPFVRIKKYLFLWNFSSLDSAARLRMFLVLFCSVYINVQKFHLKTNKTLIDWKKCFNLSKKKRPFTLLELRFFKWSLKFSPIIMYKLTRQKTAALRTGLWLLSQAISNAFSMSGKSLLHSSGFIWSIVFCIILMAIKFFGYSAVLIRGSRTRAHGSGGRHRAAVHMTSSTTLDISLGGDSLYFSTSLSMVSSM